MACAPLACYTHPDLPCPYARLPHSISGAVVGVYYYTTLFTPTPTLLLLDSHTPVIFLARPLHLPEDRSRIGCLTGSARLRVRPPVRALLARSHCGKRAHRPPSTPPLGRRPDPRRTPRASSSLLPPKALRTARALSPPDALSNPRAPFASPLRSARTLTIPRAPSNPRALCKI